MGAGAVAAATIGAAVIGGGMSMMSADKAAGASKDAAARQDAMYQQTRSDLLPYSTTGYNALQGAYDIAQRGPTGGGPDYIGMAEANLPLRMTQAELEQTPGYQFALSQGLKSTQSAAAARGLGVSGAALKGAAEYSTGLANKTYQDQFNLAQKRFEDYVNLNVGQQGNLKNEFDRYNSLATLGQASAAGTATVGMNTAKAEGAFLNSAGQTQASGMMNATNALSGGVNNYLAYENAQKYGPGGAMGSDPTTKYIDSGTWT